MISPPHLQSVRLDAALYTPATPTLQIYQDSASLDLSERRKKTKKINNCVSGFLKWKKGFVGGIQKFEFLFTTQKFNLQPGP
jgi:hypothetical protein